MTGEASALPPEESARIIEELGRMGDGPVRNFRLGRERPDVPEKLTGLERLGEKLTRSLRPIFETLAQARTDIAVEPLAILRFDEWTATLPAFTSMSGYRMKPLKGGMAMAIPPSFVTALLERFYGGACGDAPTGRSEFTAGEDLLLGRLTERLLGSLMEQWAEVTPIEAALVERDTSPHHFNFLRSDDVVVVQRFRIAPLECPPAVIAITYPLAMLRGIEDQMALRVHDDAPSEDTSWRARLALALGEVALPVRSVLARPEITLGQLMALKPGDVIPIQLNATTPLLVANHGIADGQIGERDGRAALMIDHLKRS